jgi:ribosomal protein S18 acetylase RimI-like enzyme
LESLATWRERCLSWQRRDLDRALARFAFVADVTTLADDCRFAGHARTLVVRYDGLPFPAVAFHTRAENGDAPQHLRDLSRRLVSPGETFGCLVAEPEWPLVQETYQVLEVHPEWQMAFCADLVGLDRGAAVPLRPRHLQEMRGLARSEEMMAFERAPLSRGPWFGVWAEDELVAQGGTHLMLEQAAEIGNVVTAQKHRRRGYGTQVVSALLQELRSQECAVFLHVLKENETALAFYEHLGFERRRTMILARCRVGACTG